MRSPSSDPAPIRLRPLGDRLCALVPLPAEREGTGAYRRELAVILSHRAPYLRCLLVYRCLPDANAGPDLPPQAA
jgi:hypothetical protein